MADIAKDIAWMERRSKLAHFRAALEQHQAWQESRAAAEQEEQRRLAFEYEWRHNCSVCGALAGFTWEDNGDWTETRTCVICGQRETYRAILLAAG